MTQQVSIKLFHHDRLAYIYNNADEQLLIALNQTIKPHTKAIADVFYQTMLSHPGTHIYLNNELVNARLRHTMSEWITNVIRPMTPSDYAFFIEQQCQVGTVHARINISMELVNYGLSVIKGELKKIILDFLPSQQQIPEALHLMHMLIDQAGYLINETYVGNLVINQRDEQTLRIHLLSRDMALECERIRANLFDWFRNTLTQLHQFKANDKSKLPPLMHSELGMWVQHKADMIFPGLEEVARLESSFQKLDQLTEQAQKHRGKPRFKDNIEQMNQQVSSASWILSSLSEHSMKQEDSRDPLTRLLNRRFLQVIMQREIDFSMANSTPFSVLVIDIDYFKKINDTYGHDAGDTILRQFSELMLGSVRASDFIFRMGGEEFLIVLAHCQHIQAASTAEQIRTKVFNYDFRLPDNATLNITVSIGFATHDGHPDYARLLIQADKALYQAKSAGRNCIRPQATS